MAQDISNTDDIIDSRDIIERIAELEALREEIAAENMGDLIDEDRDELNALTALAEQAEGYAPDWHYGAALIRDSYFENYARELAEDIGAWSELNSGWPLTCIDWEAAANDLRMDYTSVEFDGETYWIR